MVAGSGLGPFERMILDCRPRLRICEALNLPLSSPRRRGPIRCVVAMWCGRREIESSVAMGPRLRGDDSKGKQGTDPWSAPRFVFWPAILRGPRANAHAVTAVV